MRPDATIALDDQLVERWRTCLRCGGVAAWMDLRTIGDQVWFACLCARCYDRGQGWIWVDAVLRARHIP